jgi:hypothetical protein
MRNKTVGIALLLLLVSADASAQKLNCVPADQIEHIRQILLAGIESALKNQVEHLFDVMVKDPKDQPGRAIAGIRPVVKAYIKAHAAAINWKPMPCTDAAPP